MHLLFITHYFYPEGNAPATRVYEMTRRWVKAGHEVTVITGVPNVPDGKVYKGYRNRLYQEEMIEGVRTIRVWTYLAANKGTIRRTLNYLSFMFSAVIAGRRLGRPPSGLPPSAFPSGTTPVSGLILQPSAFTSTSEPSAFPSGTTPISGLPPQADPPPADRSHLSDVALAKKVGEGGSRPDVSSVSGFRFPPSSFPSPVSDGSPSSGLKFHPSSFSSPVSDGSPSSGLILHPSAFSSSRPDVVIATSPQFFCGWAGAHVARALGCPFILEVRDIWPESIKTVGAIKTPFVINYLEKLAAKLYAHADHVVTVGDGYKLQLRKRGLYEEKISVVPNGVDRAVFSPRKPDEAFIRKYRLEGKFVVSYIGTIGMAAGLDVVLGAAVQLKAAGRNDVRFLIVGDGAELSSMRKQAEAEVLDNVVFTGRLDKSMVPAALASSSVCLVHLRKAELFKHVLPSKMYEAAAMAKPIILGVEGCAADLIKETGAGICISPGNARQLSDVVGALAEDPIQAAALGANGAGKLAPRFDFENLSAQYLLAIKSVYDHRPYANRVL